MGQTLGEGTLKRCLMCRGLRSLPGGPWGRRKLCIVACHSCDIFWTWGPGGAKTSGGRGGGGCKVIIRESS